MRGRRTRRAIAFRALWFWKTYMPRPLPWRGLRFHCHCNDAARTYHPQGQGRARERDHGRPEDSGVYDGTCESPGDRRLQHATDKRTLEKASNGVQFRMIHGEAMSMTYATDGERHKTSCTFNHLPHCSRDMHLCPLTLRSSTICKLLAPTIHCHRYP